MEINSSFKEKRDRNIYLYPSFPDITFSFRKRCNKIQPDNVHMIHLYIIFLDYRLNLPLLLLLLQDNLPPSILKILADAVYSAW